MRGERLISILILLQGNRQMTAKSLSRKLEVSERTIYRDMEALSSVGIPVIAERGKYGGWSLLENYRTNLTGLKKTEIDALFIPQSNQLLEDLGLINHFEQAHNKLIASIPMIFRENAKDMWNRIHIDPNTWFGPKEKVVYIDVLKKAIWEEKELIIEYQRRDGESKTYTIQPLGIVFKSATWYLIAIKKNNAFRNYKVSNISDVALTEKSFERPKDFNLSDYWDQSSESFIKSLLTYDVKMKIPHSILKGLELSGRFLEIINDKDNQRENEIFIKMLFENETEAESFIMSFADQIKIIEPIELKNKLLKKAQEIVVLYQNKHN